MTGSHIDTVANGGRLDGAYGVLGGLAVVEALERAGAATQRPLVVAAFTNEEGVRFQPDMMGSLVYAGGMPIEAALDTTDSDGVRLGDELERIGYAGTTPCGAVTPAQYVELHIEQGPVLEQEGVAIGVVHDLQGISWTEITIRGEANHAGTTPMALRKDAGYAAAEVTCTARRIADELGGAQVATVGVTELHPASINVVPGRVRMTVDLRNTEEALLCEAERRLDTALRELAEAEGVHIDATRVSRFEPVHFDPQVAALIDRSAATLGLSRKRMASGAGHDAQMMARICPTAMIFVPSIQGISHNPAEHTETVDLVNGAEVLLLTLSELLDADTA